MGIKIQRKDTPGQLFAEIEPSGAKPTLAPQRNSTRPMYVYAKPTAMRLICRFGNGGSSFGKSETPQ